MKFYPTEPPRVFETGRSHIIQLKDCARIELEPDEQVTFVTKSGAEYDVARKNWGFYATPSLNGRLQRFGLRALLVESPGEKFYVFLVERGCEERMQQYLESEGHRIISWMDTGDALKRLDTAVEAESCLCGSRNFHGVFVYTAPPEGEIRFRFSSSAGYNRKVIRCGNCGHFLSIHEMNEGALYSGEYVNSTYSQDGLRKAFERITALPPEKSDNAGRVQRVLEFAGSYLTGPSRENRRPSILDIGSGLCVFLFRMKSAGWTCTALDPDQRAVEHATNVAGVEAVHGDFKKTRELGSHDAVSFNKVLEHVADPVSMLAKSALHLRPGGFVYVEVPDGEMAVADGPGREEFFIDHRHIFSAASLAHLALKAGFQLIHLERLREPSAKYTLRAFLRPALEK